MPTLFTISALGCVVAKSAVLMMVLRGLMGAGMGLAATGMVGLIAEMYEDENERGSIVGYYNSVMSVMGTIFSYLAGHLALINWHYVFLVFLIMVPVTIAIFIFLPETEPEGKHVDDAAAADEKVPWIKVLSLVAAALVVNGIYAVVLTDISIIVSELNIGDSSTAGLMGFLGTIGSLIGCLVFGRLFEKCKNWLPVIYTGLMAIGFFGLFFSTSAIACGAMCVLIGGMYGMSFSYYLVYASIIVPPSKASLSISFANAAVYLGIFLGPYVPTIYQSIFGKDTIHAVIPYMVITLAIATVLSVVMSIRRGKA